MTKQNFNSFFNPLNDFNQMLHVILLLIRTKCTLNYEEYATILTEHLKKRFLPRNIELAVNKLPGLFSSNEKIENLIQMLIEFDQMCEKVQKRVENKLKACLKCNINLVQSQQFNVTCYDMSIATNDIIYVHKCPNCHASYYPSYYTNELDNKFNYDRFNENDYFLLSKKTAFTKNFMTTLFTLVFKNAISLKGNVKKF